MVALNEKLHYEGTIPISVYGLRKSGKAARSNRCRAGKSEESGKSVDHVPTLAARPLVTSATSV